MTNDALEQLIIRADSMPYNKAASQLWAQAAVMAEEQNRLPELVYSLLELQNSYYSGGEVTRQLAPFLKLQKLYAEHPEEFHDGLLHTYAWSHRYAFYVMRSVPEVPMSSIRTLLDQAHDLYKQLGDSRRALFQQEYRFARMQGDTELMEQMHTKWMNAEETDLSNCAGCDPEFAATYYFNQDRWQEGIAVAEEAIRTEEATCKNQPHSLLTELLEAYIQVGSYERAWQSHLRAYRKIKSDPVYLGMLPQHMETLIDLARAGREHCRTVAKDIFVRHLPWWTSAEDPETVLRLSTSAALVCAALPEDETLKAVLPGGDLPWTTAPTLENPTAAAAYQWCVDIARDLAERFDARPGLTHPTEVAYLERRLAEQPAPAITTPSIVDVSGLFLHESLSEELKAGDTPTEDTYTYPDLSHALHGEWITWDIDRLLQEHQKVGGTTSSFLSLAIDKGANAQQEETPATIDPVHAELDKATDLLEHGRIEEACALADEVLRRDPTGHIDPVGVRLRGLEILANGASRAGYPEEAITVQRVRINTAAAAGLRGELVRAAAETTRVLHRLRRSIEAGNVAQNALLFAESIAQVPARTQDVRDLQELYTKALVAEEDYYSAAQATLEQVQLIDDAEKKAELLSEAAERFQVSHHFDDAQRCLREAIALADSLDDKPTQARLRNQLSFVIAWQPWYISDEDVAKIRQLEEERRAIMGEDQPTIVAECYAKEATILAIAERPHLVEEPLAKAESVLREHNQLGTLLAEYIRIANVLEAEEDTQVGRRCAVAAVKLAKELPTVSLRIRKQVEELIEDYDLDETL